MPVIDDVKTAREIGRVGYERYAWLACSTCGKERWVPLLRGKAKYSLCQSCAARITRKNIHQNADKNPMWKGGRRKSRGYILVKLQPDDFFYPMTEKSGYVFEHRLIVAKALGRCLHPWEIVHHKRGYAKDDNRYPKTLQLVTDERHNQITILENKISHLEKRITILEAENILLKAGNGN